MSPDAGVGETLLFLSKQCLAIDGICSKALPKTILGTWVSTSPHVLCILAAEQELRTCTLHSRRHFSMRLIPAYKEPLPC